MVQFSPSLFPLLLLLHPPPAANPDQAGSTACTGWPRLQRCGCGDHLFRFALPAARNLGFPESCWHAGVSESHDSSGPPARPAIPTVSRSGCGPESCPAARWPGRGSGADLEPGRVRPREGKARAQSSPWDQEKADPQRCTRPWCAHPHTNEHHRRRRKHAREVQSTSIAGARWPCRE